MNTNLDRKAEKLNKVIKGTKQDSKLNREIGPEKIALLRERAIYELLTVEYLRCLQNPESWQPKQSVSDHL